jgi:hemerythrin-like domain-containing protein
MRPIDPLMDEHRRIERMVALMRRESAHVREVSLVDTVFVDAFVDYFRTYTDRTHHGKEEGILFRALEGKPLSAEDRKTMEGLIEGHRWARRTVSELDEAKQAYLSGRYIALHTVVEKLDALVGFYPGHIQLEDHTFFPASMVYLTPQEQQAMLNEFWEWDRNMIHEKYRSVVDELERKLAAMPEAPRR